MIRHLSLARVLVALGIVSLVAPALVPVQPVLYHDTGPGTTANATQLEANGVEVIAYENLSERGKQLYRETLRHNGRYAAPLGQGAPEFDYTTPDDDSPGPRERRSFDGIAIERPPDADLPPADEPTRAIEAAAERERRGAANERSNNDTASAGNGSAAANETTLSEAERRERLEEQRRQVVRYDLMTTSRGAPPLTAGSNLLRLLSVVVGVVAIGVGGYRSSRP